MAGDWIKMTHNLPEKPEVLAISGKTGLNRFDVVGRLFIVWRWFDNNTTDGNARGVTSVTLEECLFGYSSNVAFVSAVISAGWLVETDEGIHVVKFDEHISESAKVRAQTAKRVAKSKKKGKGNAAGNADSVTETVPREEKRREEEIPSDAYASGAATPPISPTAAAQDQVFATGVALLTAADVTDKNARSFLAAQCKAHGPERVLDALQACAAERAIQPVPWLVQALGGTGKGRPRPNAQEQLEASNREIARRWAEGNTHAGA